jgi:hypothetical protein
MSLYGLIVIRAVLMAAATQTGIHGLILTDMDRSNPDVWHSARALENMDMELDQLMVESIGKRSARSENQHEAKC